MGPVYLTVDLTDLYAERTRIYGQLPRHQRARELVSTVSNSHRWFQQTH